MKKLVFTHFCEDIAMRIFLEKALDQLPKHIGADVKFEHRENRRIPIPANREEVESKFAEAAIKVFQDREVNLFIVGMDYDDSDRKRFEEKHAYFKNQLSSNHQPNTLILLPVQAIEHWLCYLKQKTDDPQGTRNVSLEGKERRQAKIEIYGSPKVSVPKCTEAVNKLTESIDFDWLRNRSHSFNHFYRQIEPIMKAM